MYLDTLKSEEMRDCHEMINLLDSEFHGIYLYLVKITYFMDSKQCIVSTL